MDNNNLKHHAIMDDLIPYELSGDGKLHDLGQSIRMTTSGDFVQIHNGDVVATFKRSELLFRFRPCPIDTTMATSDSDASDPVIENNFKYHAPTGNSQLNRYQRIRDSAKAFAYLIKGLTPSSREQSLAITKLEEAMMWANSAIARNEKA